MNLNEAYKELGLSSNASKDDVKKAFRKLAAEHHPDKGGSEDKFKKVNEAYQMCLNPEKHKPFFNNPYVYTTSTSTSFNAEDFHDLFNNIFSKQYKSQPKRSYDTYVNYYAGSSKTPKATITIDFAQAVLGCTVEVKFSRKSICEDCLGKGIRVSYEAKSCSRCGGTGYETKEADYKEGQNKFNYRPNRICSSCNGRGGVEQTKTCTTCNGEQKLEPHTVKVNIPPGAKNGNIRLSGQGDMMFGHRQDVYVKLIVKPDPELELVGNDVLSSLKISLLEALKGTNKKVRTVSGERTLKVPPKIRHLTSLRVAGLGVKGRGDHIVLVEVEYPEDKIDKIIEILSDEDILPIEKEPKKEQE